MATRTELIARQKADQKRLAALGGRDVLGAILKLSAREIFVEAQARRLAARPVIGQDRGPFKLDKTGRKRYLGKPTPILGASTFQNRIVDGAWV